MKFICILSVFISSFFQTQNIPEVCFMGHRGNATLDVKTAKVGTALGSILINDMLPVLSFEMTITTGGHSTTTVSNANNFTPEQKTLISKIKPGSKIIFDKVKVRMSDGKIIALAPGTYTIK
ncbi:MAG: GldM family protein [Bacteroidota bacterium]